MNNKSDIDDISLNRQNFWKQYDIFFKTNTQMAKYRREYISDIVCNNNIKSVLELGCNSGANLLYISKKCPTVRLVGIDINKNALKYGKEIEKNPAEMIPCSLYDLSQFEDNSFDIVFTCTVLIHIPSEKVESIIKEMLRISSNFVMNIEDNQENNKVYWYREGIPQRWETNYEEIYKNNGIVPNIHDVKKLMGTTSGGANHLLWHSKKNDKLILAANK